MVILHAGEEVYVVQGMRALQGVCEESCSEGPRSFPIRALAMPWPQQEDGREIRILALPFDYFSELIPVTPLCA